MISPFAAGFLYELIVIAGWLLLFLVAVLETSLGIAAGATGAAAAALAFHCLKLDASSLGSVLFHLALVGDGRVVLVGISNLKIESLAIELVVAQRAYHVVGFALLHIKKGVVGQQVDAAYSYVLSLTRGVNHANEVGGIESV